MIINELSTAGMLLGSSEQYRWTFRLRYTMTDTVDGEALNWAVQESIKRYPYFALEVYLDQESQRLGTIPNSRPIVVNHGDAPLNLHTEAVNYHVFYVNYEGKLISINFNHAFCDGPGIFPFVHTLLFLYIYRKTGVMPDKAGVWLPGEEISEEELYDPLRDMLNNDAVAAKANNLQTVPFFVPIEQPGKVYYMLTMPEDAFLKKAKAAGSSPAALLPAYMCRAIFDLNPGKIGTVVSEIAVNPRFALAAEKSHCNLACGAYISYPDTQSEWTVDALARYGRQMIKDYVTSPDLLADIKENARINQQLLNMKPGKALRLANAIGFHKLYLSTFACSYAGKMNWGNLEKHIESLSVLTDAVENGLLLELLSINSRFHITVNQPFTDDRYVKRLAELLREDGIPCECSEAIPLELSAADMRWLM